MNTKLDTYRNRFNYNNQNNTFWTPNLNVLLTRSTKSYGIEIQAVSMFRYERLQMYQDRSGERWNQSGLWRNLV